MLCCSVLEAVSSAFLLLTLLTPETEGKEISAAFCNSQSKGGLLNHLASRKPQQQQQQQLRNFLPDLTFHSSSASSLLKYKSNNDNHQDENNKESNHLESLIEKLDNVLEDDKTNNLGTMLLALEQMIEREKERKAKEVSRMKAKQQAARIQRTKKAEADPTPPKTEEVEETKSTDNKHSDIKDSRKEDLLETDDDNDDDNVESWWKQQIIDELMDDIDILLKIQNATTIDDAMIILENQNNNSKNKKKKSKGGIEVIVKAASAAAKEGDGRRLSSELSEPSDEVNLEEDEEDDVFVAHGEEEKQKPQITSLSSSTTTTSELPVSSEEEAADINETPINGDGAYNGAVNGGGDAVNGGVAAVNNSSGSSSSSSSKPPVVDTAPSREDDDSVEMIEENKVNGKVNDASLNIEAVNVSADYSKSNGGSINGAVNGAVNGVTDKTGSNDPVNDRSSQLVNGAVNGVVNGSAKGSINGDGAVNGAVNGMKDTSDSVSRDDDKTAPPSRDKKLAFFATPQNSKSRTSTTKSKDNESHSYAEDVNGLLAPNGEEASTEEVVTTEETVVVVNGLSKQNSVFFGSAVGNGDDNSKDIAEIAAKIAEEEEEGLSKISEDKSEKVSKEPASTTKLKPSLSLSSRKATTPKPKQVTVKMERNLYSVTPSEAKKAWLDIVWKNGDGLPSLVLTLKRNSEGLHTKRLIFPSFAEEHLTGGSDSDNNTIEYKVSRQGLFGSDRVANSHVGIVSFEETDEGTLMKWNIKFDVSGRQAFWKRVTEIIVGSQCDSLSAYLAEPQIISNESEFPGKQPKEIMDAWIEFVWKQGGDLPLTPKPVNLGGNERAIFPMFLRERIDSVDYEKKEIVYHAENPSFVHCQEGFVQFEYDDAKDLTTMRWRVEVLPYNNLNIPVNVFTSFVVSTLAGNLRKYVLNPKLYADEKKTEYADEKRTETTTESVAAKALTWVKATKSTIEDLQNKAFQSMVEKKSSDIDKSLAYFLEEAKAVEMSYGDGASVGRPTFSLGKGFDYGDYVYGDDIASNEVDETDSIFRGTYSLGQDDEEDEKWRPTRSIAD